MNSVLGRREARLRVNHEGSGTPDRLTVRRLASEHFKAPVESVFVRSISTRTGGSSALCMVEIYADPKTAERVLPGYVKNRNLPKDQRVTKKKGEEAKAPPPAAAETPKPAAKKAEAKEPKAEEAKPGNKD